MSDERPTRLESYLAAQREAQENIDAHNAVRADLVREEIEAYNAPEAQAARKALADAYYKNHDADADQPREHTPWRPAPRPTDTTQPTMTFAEHHSASAAAVRRGERTVEEHLAFLRQVRGAVPSQESGDAQQRLAVILNDKNHPYWHGDAPGHKEAVAEVAKLYESGFGAT